MRENYDVIVVGAGPAGIMASYEFVLKNPNLSVLLIDKGRAVTEDIVLSKIRRSNSVQ